MKLTHLLEMPQIVYFNYGTANDKIQKILKNFKITDFEIVDKKLNLYKSTDGPWSEIWFIIFNKKKTDIDFIVKFKQDAIKLQKTIPVITPYFTYKKNDNLDSIVSKVYKIASKTLKRPILSDLKQTDDMASIWISFMENKSKYNIKFCEFVDTKTNKIMNKDDITKTDHGIFNKFEQGLRYRILLDYKNTMIESLEEDESNSIYFLGVK